MIGIIAAMQEEIDELVALMENVKILEVSHISFYQGILHHQEIMLMKSGVGKGNAAMATTVLLDRYHPNYIINIGTAGGLIPDENILDIVVSEDIVQHDYDTSGIDGVEGIGLYFQSDSELRTICKNVLSDLNKPYHCGLIASGDQFVCEDEQVQKLMARFPNAICAEMEAGAIAQVCSSYQVPFIILRSLSDNACKQNSHMDFLEYVTHASKASAIVCKQIVSHIHS